MGIINDGFLLKSDTAKRLYEAAKDMPIIDYHCHIDPREIYENRRFDNITQVWLGGDTINGALCVQMALRKTK